MPKPSMAASYTAAVKQEARAGQDADVWRLTDDAKVVVGATDVIFVTNIADLMTALYDRYKDQDGMAQLRIDHQYTPDADAIGAAPPGAKPSSRYHSCYLGNDPATIASLFKKYRSLVVPADALGNLPTINGHEIRQAKVYGLPYAISDDYAIISCWRQRQPGKPTAPKEHLSADDFGKLANAFRVISDGLDAIPYLRYEKSIYASCKLTMLYVVLLTHVYGPKAHRQVPEFRKFAERWARGVRPRNMKNLGVFVRFMDAESTITKWPRAKATWAKKYKLP